ncbi:MAG: hypothetical protein ING30_08230 [Burkholderiales bacterium]|nr:hypothetical protein [Burkholderiales bacterium]
MAAIMAALSALPLAQIAFNGTQARERLRRLNKADRQMPTCLCCLGRGLCVGVVLAADRILDQLEDRGATFTQQHVVEIRAGRCRHGNAHLAPFKLQLGGGGFRSAQLAARVAAMSRCVKMLRSKARCASGISSAARVIARCAS